MIQIERLIPHRYPFLLIDEIKEWKPYEYLKAVKNVSRGEPFTQGHFPGLPIMPGVLIIESCAQASGALLALSSQTPGKETDSKTEDIYALGKVKNFSFKKPVLPGNQLVIEVVLTKAISSSAIVEVTASVDDNIVAQGELFFGKLDRNLL